MKNQDNCRYHGPCTACGKTQFFSIDKSHGSVFKSKCEGCSLNIRERLIAALIIANFGEGTVISLDSMIRKKLRSNTLPRVLDLVQGRHPFFKFIVHENNHAVRIDPTEYKGRPFVSTEDLTSGGLNFEDSSKDLIISRNVLPRVSDHVRMISEFHRVLSPGGTLILAPSLKWPLPKETEDVAPSNSSKPSNVRHFGADLVKMLEDAGFSVTLRRPGFLLDTARRLPIFEAIKIEHATKNTEQNYA